MERNFYHVLGEIKKIAPKKLKDALEESVPYWAPEVRWLKLSEYVNKYVIPNSQDKVSVKVYALLCDCSEKQIRTRFIQNGF